MIATTLRAWEGHEDEEVRDSEGDRHPGSAGSLQSSSGYEDLSDSDEGGLQAEDSLDSQPESESEIHTPKRRQKSSDGRSRIPATTDPTRPATSSPSTRHLARRLQSEEHPMPCLLLCEFSSLDEAKAQQFKELMDVLFKNVKINFVEGTTFTEGTRFYARQPGPDEVDQIHNTYAYNAIMYFNMQNPTVSESSNDRDQRGLSRFI
ncbi:hypothetical protein F4782DRAFT_551112 [Xylaria castorea]|nr:hypothetical protein F4782DRAFT_551112 [Xylaria castorea]